MARPPASRSTPRAAGRAAPRSGTARANPTTKRASATRESPKAARPQAEKKPAKPRARKPPPALTGKQKRHLRALGHHLSPVVHLGKNGVTDGVVAAVDAALETHELIKIRFGAEMPEDRDEVAGLLADETASSVAQRMGGTLLLYRRHPSEPKINLPLAPRAESTVVEHDGNHGDEEVEDEDEDEDEDASAPSTSARDEAEDDDEDEDDDDDASAPSTSARDEEE